MIKTLSNILKQDREAFIIPKKVQDMIPIQSVWPDGIFLNGKNKFSKMYRFTDINYAVASRDDKEGMFLEYSELLNSLDSGCTAKFTINNRRLNMLDFEDRILLKMKGDKLDVYRREYNDMLLEKATGANGITQEKYITVSIYKKSIEEARTYYARVGADLQMRFSSLGSTLEELDAVERLRIFHDFYRQGEEINFEFDMNQKAKLGHDFKDYICPDTIERGNDPWQQSIRSKDGTRQFWIRWTGLWWKKARTRSRTN